MRKSSLTAALIVMTAPLFALSTSQAQIPLYQLPKDDFIWYWGGAQNEAERRGIADLDVGGGEAGFRCELTARLSPANNMSPQEINQVENDLRTRIDFIYAASEALNYLEQTRNLDWAVLDCKQYEGEPPSESERAERENRAREKMQRELDRRRARASKNAAE